MKGIFSKPYKQFVFRSKHKSKSIDHLQSIVGGFIFFHDIIHMVS